jgi:hypothetical protein
MGIKRPKNWEPWEFENGRLRKSFPEDIISEGITDQSEEIYRSFMLTLSLVFNDLKALVLLNDTVRNAYETPEVIQTDAHSGEKEGVGLYLLKTLLSTLHESIVFLKESEEIYNSVRFQKILVRTSKNTRDVWEVLIKIATEKDVVVPQWIEFKELADFLKILRNNVGFHFQTRKSLVKGYRKFFFYGIRGVPDKNREIAYRSTESEFMNSRYYYADAALQGYLVNLFGDEEQTKERVDEAFKLLNLIGYSIHDVLREYHQTLPNR